MSMRLFPFLGCFDCKSTKNLRAIHNRHYRLPSTNSVVSTAKVQKIWEQFTTISINFLTTRTLFRLQKYKKFESNSQLSLIVMKFSQRCFDCKSTKNLRAIHNNMNYDENYKRLFRLQKYKKFESNSQLLRPSTATKACCFDCKSTKNLRAIHNYSQNQPLSFIVVSTAKVQKIWEQFTTHIANKRNS